MHAFPGPSAKRLHRWHPSASFYTALLYLIRFPVLRFYKTLECSIQFLMLLAPVIFSSSTEAPEAALLSPSGEKIETEAANPRRPA